MQNTVSILLWSVYRMVCLCVEFSYNKNSNINILQLRLCNVMGFPSAYQTLASIYYMYISTHIQFSCVQVNCLSLFAGYISSGYGDWEKHPGLFSQSLWEQNDTYCSTQTVHNHSCWPDSCSQRWRACRERNVCRLIIICVTERLFCTL